MKYGGIELGGTKVVYRTGEKRLIISRGEMENNQF